MTSGRKLIAGFSRDLRRDAIRTRSRRNRRIRPERILARQIDLFAGASGDPQRGETRYPKEWSAGVGSIKLQHQDFLADGYFRADFCTANKCPQRAGGDGSGIARVVVQCGRSPAHGRARKCCDSFDFSDGRRFLSRMSSTPHRRSRAYAPTSARPIGKPPKRRFNEQTMATAYGELFG